MRASSLRGSLLVTVVAAGCSNRSPKLLSATPHTICANEDWTVTLTGSDLDASKVEIGSAADIGGAPPVARLVARLPRRMQ
jgi:hypothetical protein